MSDKALHCSVLFGLNEDVVSNRELESLLKEHRIDKIKLGELSYINGYENICKVLTIVVLDSDNKLNTLHNSIEDFVLKENSDFQVREFKPHLTLAYVKNEYELPKDFSLPLDIIEVAETKISLLSEFNRSVNL